MSQRSPGNLIRGALTAAFREAFSSSYSWTDLHWAAYTKDHNTVRQLLVNGENINQIDSNGSTPLHLACERDHNANCIWTLLKSKPDINLRDNSLDTPLNIVVRRTTYNAKLIREFLKFGADPNIPDLMGNTPLHRVALGAECPSDLRLKIAEALIDNNANVNLVNNEGDTPLHIAIVDGFEGLVRLLLQNGADINMENNSGYTQFDFAALLIYHFPSILEYIGKHYILQCYFRKTPLSLQLLKQLIKVESLRVFKNKCFMEYLQLKTSNIGPSVIKYSDILTKSSNTIANYMKEHDVLESLVLFDTGKYEIFANHLSQNLQKALVRFDAVEYGYNFIRKLEPALNDECIAKIVENLTNEDLYKLKFFDFTQS